MAARLAELSLISETNEDVTLQMQSEAYLSVDAERARKKQEFENWASAEADTYLTKPPEKIKDEDIDRLASEIGF